MLDGTHSIPTRSLAAPGGRRTPLLAGLCLCLAVLAGCGTRGTPAPVTDLTQQPDAPAVSSAGTYVVKPKDSLFRIAREHGVDVATLARLNNLSDPGQLRVGQVLRLSDAAPGTAAAPTVPTAPPAPATPAPAAPEATPEPVRPVPPSEPTQVARASDAGLISWGWPASGKIIQGFNVNTKGIDIAGEPGDAVIAAAAGEVMYAGNGVRGLGNLVLLGHSNGFITAYAHNSKLLVKTGQQIKKGEKVAEIGQTDTTSPRLHFEIRRRGTPVNPLAYLPQR